MMMMMLRRWWLGTSLLLLLLLLLKSSGSWIHHHEGGRGGRQDVVVAVVVGRAGRCVGSSRWIVRHHLLQPHVSSSGKPGFGQGTVDNGFIFDLMRRNDHGKGRSDLRRRKGNRRLQWRRWWRTVATGVANQGCRGSLGWWLLLLLRHGKRRTCGTAGRIGTPRWMTQPFQLCRCNVGG